MDGSPCPTSIPRWDRAIRIRGHSWLGAVVKWKIGADEPSKDLLENEKVGASRDSYLGCQNQDCDANLAARVDVGSVSQHLAPVTDLG
jgi:hypothetical protein